MARSDRVTIDEATTGKYQQAGISGEYNQSRYGKNKPKNVQVDERRSVREGREAGEERSRITQVITENQPNARRLAGTGTRAQKIAQVSNAGSKKKAHKTMRARGRATAVNTSIMSWLVPSYLFFQLPFALLNIFFFGLLAVQLQITSEAEEIMDGDTVLGTVTTFLFNGARFIAEGLNNAIDYIFDFNIMEAFAAISPGNLYMMTVVVILGYAIIVMLTMGLIYLFNNLRSLSGEGSTGKIAAFIGCLVGYTLPITNLVPWAVVWGLMVWKNPK